MEQTFINILVGMVATLFGWLLKTIWNSVAALQKADEELTEKVNRIEVLVAGEYVKRDEFQGALTRLFQKLDNIENKIDKKADK
tara:strand:- start:374 stop:625 length:252 start_codon:yes stop_codon:yes gene_type:complete